MKRFVLIYLLRRIHVFVKSYFNFVLSVNEIFFYQSLTIP